MQILQLAIKDFKGIKALTIPFNVVTNIYGDNAVGKTTIADAFSWLLFDKDSQERSAFEIKPLDENNEPIHFLQTEVYGTFIHNTKTFSLRKVFEEKWVKKRGQAEQEFSGHTTTYYIDEVPVKKAEYQKFISDILDEKTFRLLTNPFAFENMKWQDKRNLLFEMCGDVTDEEIISADEKFTALAGQDIERLKKSTAALKKQLKIDIQNIPPRIDELTATIQEVDTKNIRVAIKAKEKELKKLEEQLEASNEAFEEKRVKQQEIFKLENDLNLLKMKLLTDSNKELNEIKVKANSLEQTVRQKEYTLQSKQQAIKSFCNEISKYENEMKILRNQYSDELKKVFNLHVNCICPTCNQELPDETVRSKEQELITNFEKQKQDTLSGINQKGIEKKEYVEKCNAEKSKLEIEINTLTTELVQERTSLNALKAKIKELEQQPTPTSTPEIEATESNIQALRKELEAFEEPDTTTIKLLKQEVSKEIDDLKQELTKAAIQEGTKARIEELKEKHKDLNLQLADVEQQEFLAEEFTRAKVDMLTERINSRFKHVTFKLFKQQVNGGIEECCESLIEGVPFSNANNAARINAGLDIINTLTDHFQFTAPIFIDNAESVNELIETNSQVVRLVVSKDKELRVE